MQWDAKAGRERARGILAVAFALAGCQTAAFPTTIDLGPTDLAGDDLASLCPNNLPADCPNDMGPSYMSQIGPLVDDRCVPCHSPGGLASDKPLQTYSEVHNLRSEVLTQVYSCTMPPADAGVLSPAQRLMLLQWLVCHSPNN